MVVGPGLTGLLGPGLNFGIVFISLVGLRDRGVLLANFIGFSISGDEIERRYLANLSRVGLATKDASLKISSSTLRGTVDAQYSRTPKAT